MNDLTILPFGPILAKTEVTQDELKKLREYSTHTKDNVNHNLAACCEEQLSFEDSYNEKIFEIIHPKINEYLKSVGHIKYNENLGFDFKYQALWLVNQKAGEFNPMHDHASDVSFVVYLDIPEEIYGEGRTTTGIPAGAIEFVYGKDVQGYRKEHFLNPINNHIHIPVSGEMFIFPSTLFHHVNSFKSDVTRVCIAGNIVITDIGNIN